MQLFDGPLLLSGAISNGNAILAAQAAGADLAYVGSAFIATDEANADERYKQGIVNQAAEANPATAHMFIINPLSGHGVDNLFATHPSTANRIAALQQLAAELGTQTAPRPAGATYPPRSPWGGASGQRGPWG